MPRPMIPLIPMSSAPTVTELATPMPVTRSSGYLTKNDPGKEWPLLLRRNDKLIVETYNELWEKVWWNRHQALRRQMDNGEGTLGVEQLAIFEAAEKGPREIEEKYGR